MIDEQPRRSTLTQRKRQAILLAARGEFLEAGYRDTSMDRVAARAAVSKRTVYNHFPGKEALFIAVAGVFIEEMQQAVSVEYQTERTLVEQLIEIAEKEAELITREDYVAIFRVFLTEVSHFPDLFNSVLASSGNGHNPVEKWITYAVADGRLVVDDARLASTQFVSLIKGALFWPQVAGYGEKASTSERQTVIDGAVAMFLDHDLALGLT